MDSTSNSTQPLNRYTEIVTATRPNHQYESCTDASTHKYRVFIFKISRLTAQTTPTSLATHGAPLQRKQLVSTWIILLYVTTSRERLQGVHVHHVHVSKYTRLRPPFYAAAFVRAFSYFQVLPGSFVWHLVKCGFVRSLVLKLERTLAPNLSWEAL